MVSSASLARVPMMIMPISQITVEPKMSSLRSIRSASADMITAPSGYPMAPMPRYRMEFPMSWPWAENKVAASPRKP